MSYSALCFLVRNTALSKLVLNYSVDGQSGWNLRDSCGTEEKAFTGTQQPCQDPGCLTWAAACLSGSNCRNASSTLHWHPSCVPVDESCDNVYMFVNFTSFFLSCSLSGCYSYLSQAWAERIKKQKARSSHSGWLEGQGSCQMLQTKSNKSGIRLHLLMIIVFDKVTCARVYIHYRASEMISLRLLEHRNV